MPRRAAKTQPKTAALAAADAVHVPNTQTSGTSAVSPLEDVPIGLTVGGASRALFDDPAAKLTSLEEIADVVAGVPPMPALRDGASIPCRATATPTRTSCASARRPARTRTRQGEPFVGQAGQLLTKILGAIDLKREDVFIANVLKHRPPGNRNPMPDEVVACSPVSGAADRARPTESHPGARDLRGPNSPRDEAHDRQAARAGAPLLRRAADRDLPPRRAAAEPRLEAPHLGRCPARPSNTRSRPPSWGVTPTVTGVPPTRRTPSRPCWRRCSSTRTRSCAPWKSSTTPCSTRSGTGGCSAACSRITERGSVVDPLTLADELQRRGDLEGARRQGLHRLPRRRGAHVGERRVPREDRQGEGASPPADRGLDRDRRRGVPRRPDGGRAARPGRAEDLPGRAAAHVARASRASRSCSGRRWSASRRIQRRRRVHHRHRRAASPISTR